MAPKKGVFPGLLLIDPTRMAVLDFSTVWRAVKSKKSSIMRAFYDQLLIVSKRLTRALPLDFGVRVMPHEVGR